MRCICLWDPEWEEAGPPEALAVTLLELAPRVALGREVVWVDARGLPAAALASRLLERVAGARAGIADTPVAAEVGARTAEPGEWIRVEPGGDRAFLASVPIGLLRPDARLRAFLDGVGIGVCGDLAALEREAVEVRFGRDGVALWRLARGDDPRRLFTALPREQPHASLDFIDYVLTDPARLVFVANALLGSICDALRARGEHARRMTLSLALANGARWHRALRPARPTASRATWLRLVRAELERLTVPDAVAGVELGVDASEPAGVCQGDLFDRGFATAEAVEAAVARIIEEHGPVVVRPEVVPHPLAERRTRWVPVEPAVASATVLRDASAVLQGEVAGVSRERGSGAPVRAFGGGLRVVEGEGGAARPGDAGAVVRLGVVEGGEGDAPGEDGARLKLHLLPEPRPIVVESVPCRDHRVPVRYRDRQGWRELVTAAGPDRVSGERWGEAYAREYFRCVTAEGVLIWLFRDARKESWYLHGWWD